MPKLVLISDTHSKHRQLKLPEGDILIHAGDITWHGEEAIEKDFLNWLHELPFKHKTFIAGNHDSNFIGASPYTAPYGTGTIHYLSDSGVELEGLTFWGSPWIPEFALWAFMYPRGTDRWNAIPENVDVLITHGPPAGILDRPFKIYLGVGCQDLGLRVFGVQPLLHVFGHIHGDYGQHQVAGHPTLFVNASSVDEGYKVVNPPVVVEF